MSENKDTWSDMKSGTVKTDSDGRTYVMKEGLRAGTNFIYRDYEYDKK